MTQCLLRRDAGGFAQPGAEVGQRPFAHSPLAGAALVAAQEAAAVGMALGRLHRRQQAVVDVHRLERTLAAIQVAAGDVADQGAKGSGVRRGLSGLAQGLGGGEPAGQQADGGAEAGAGRPP